MRLPKIEKEKRVLYDVYPVVNGCSTECIFTGTMRQIRLFVNRQRMKVKGFDYILLPSGY